MKQILIPLENWQMKGLWINPQTFFIGFIMEKITKEINKDGIIRYRNKNNQLHNINDEPAIIHTNGIKWWCKNGKRHRTKGPAEIFPSGNEYWWYEDKPITEQVNQLMEDGNISSDWKNWTEEDEILFVLLIS